MLRCWWCGDDPAYVAYHDTEWGRRPRDDRALFELLSLEGMQAGLSWLTILRKREEFRRAFRDFDPFAVSAMTSADVDVLLSNPGIVRHRGKIEAAISNSKILTSMYQRGESLAGVCEPYATSRPRPRPGVDDVPGLTSESTALSSTLRRRGFRFVGPTTVYAFMQAAGFVDDHIEGCHVVDVQSSS